MATANLPPLTVKFDIPNKVFSGLAKLAKQRGNMPNAEAKDMFLAAYSARHHPTGDEALDEAVASMGPSPASLAGDEKLRAKITAMAAQIEAAAGVAKQLEEARAEIERLKVEAPEKQLGLPAPDSDEITANLRGQLRVKEEELFNSKSEAAKLSRDLMDAKDQIALLEQGASEAARANGGLKSALGIKDTLLSAAEEALAEKQAEVGRKDKLLAETHDLWAEGQASVTRITDMYNQAAAALDKKSQVIETMGAEARAQGDAYTALLSEADELRAFRDNLLQPPAGEMYVEAASAARPNLVIRLDRAGRAASLKIDLMGETTAFAAEGIKAACKAFYEYVDPEEAPHAIGNGKGGNTDAQDIRLD